MRGEPTTPRLEGVASPRITEERSDPNLVGSEYSAPSGRSELVNEVRMSRP